MKSVLSKFTSTFAALLGDSTVLDADGRLEDIRNAMFEALMPHIGGQTEMPTVWTGVARAVDVQTLWYLRSDLLGFLADHSSEAAANHAIAAITEMFRGVIPDTLMPRARRRGF